MEHFVLLARVTGCSFSKAEILFLSSKAFLRIIFSVIFNSINSSTCWQNELHWIYWFKSFHIWIQTSYYNLINNAFNGTCVRLTSITFPVIWSSVLISVTREWRYCGLIYKFFLINNRVKVFVCPVPKISQVMVKWRRRASHLGRFTLWHNGCRATQLVNLLCDKTAVELHNSVNLLCGVTAAELNPVWCMHQ